MGTILGLDVGYSGLKIAFGPSSAEGPRRIRSLPSGAVRKADYAPNLTGRPEEAVEVLVDDQEWVAGVDPERMAHQVRQIHEEFPGTRIYKALVNAGLLATGSTELEAVVTGLPVSQFREGAHAHALKERLTGIQHVTREGTVSVGETLVAPQPIGTFATLVAEHREEPLLLEGIEQGRLVIVDCGHFSLDWAVLDGGTLRSDLGGTSMEAMSALLEDTADRIGRDQGGKLAPERIESALREGHDQPLFQGQRIQAQGYLEASARRVAEKAAAEMRQDMRKVRDQDPDVLALTGGGAGHFGRAFRGVFPGSRVVTPNDPVTANARGFWYFRRFGREGRE